MLEIRGRGGGGADDRRVERPAQRGEQEEAGNAAERLEPPRRHVLVRHRVSRGVHEEAEAERTGW